MGVYTLVVFLNRSQFPPTFPSKSWQKTGKKEKYKVLRIPSGKKDASFIKRFIGGLATGFSFIGVVAFETSKRLRKHA